VDFGGCEVSFVDPSRNDLRERFDARHKRVWPAWKWALACLVATLVAYTSLPEQKPFVNPRIVAEAYVWPDGCIEKRYVDLDKIQHACLTSNYAIGDGQQWGWKRTSKWPHYYRVGTDAVLVTDIWSREAKIFNVVRDVFVVKDSNEHSVAGDAISKS
jgi:hypothetical protein